jgi:hypothetical protein
VAQRLNQLLTAYADMKRETTTPILTTPRRADDAEGAASLARLVHGIAAATHRRWLRAL